MRQMFDSFVSLIIFIMIVFGIVSFSVAEMQVMTARRIHTAVVNQVQSSYYNVDVNEINSKLKQSFGTHREAGADKANWVVSVTPVKTVADRRDSLVTLRYRIILPVFNVAEEGQIDGYAR